MRSSAADAVLEHSLVEHLLGSSTIGINEFRPSMAEKNQLPSSEYSENKKPYSKSFSQVARCSRYGNAGGSGRSFTPLLIAHTNFEVSTMILMTTCNDFISSSRAALYREPAVSCSVKEQLLLEGNGSSGNSASGFALWQLDGATGECFR